MKPNQFKTIMDFVFELIQRSFADKPKFFKVLQIVSIVAGGALALLTWVLDPLTALELSPKLHTIFSYLVVVFGTLAGAAQLPVKDPTKDI